MEREKHEVEWVKENWIWEELGGGKYDQNTLYIALKE